jgi:hypothetical protein
MTSSASSSTVRVFWTNHGYFAGETFANVADAVAFVRNVFFEATIYVGAEVVGAWTMFGGYRPLAEGGRI